MGIIYNSDYQWMQQAYNLALQAKTHNEVPVGAVIISDNNELLGCGYNQVIQNLDPCAHAEIIALRTAAQKLQNYRLLNTTLYVTLEPCIMCMGAIFHARVKRLVFATREFKSGAACSVFNLLNGYPLYYKIQIDEGIMQKECANLLLNFFENKR